jgi:hypothetical protein
VPQITRTFIQANITLAFSVKILRWPHEKKAGEKLARSMLKTICCIENYYSAFFSAIPALVFRTVNLVSAPIPKLSTSSFDWKLVGDTRAGHAESGEYGQAIEAANSKHLSHPL